MGKRIRTIWQEEQKSGRNPTGLYSRDTWRVRNRGHERVGGRGIITKRGVEEKT